jgi:hypothetical protein
MGTDNTIEEMKNAVVIVLYLVEVFVATILVAVSCSA